DVATANLPEGVSGQFQGAAKAFQTSLSTLSLLLVVAILVVYIVLGILYESHIHPLTILSGLPSAGFGALVTLIIFRMDLNIYAFVGMIMLIGIVEKNAIMQIDFALEAERRGMSSEEAIYQGCLIRFRPIMMTTMAALLGAVPIAVGYGAGGEARQPLGLVVVGGLLFSQLVTLYLTRALRIDGRLDEEIYSTVPSISGFIQQEPVDGAPATEETEVWVFFDDDNIYVVGRCWDSHPERMVANEMRRDGARVPRNEDFAFSFDTFHDRRNGFNFEVTPVGGRLDTEIINDGAVSNRDWNPVWEAVAARFEHGWNVETRIPFKSLRYRPGADQVWGFQVRRMVRWKNEISY